MYRSFVIALDLFVLACAPSAPTLGPVTPTAAAIPTQTSLATPTAIPTAIPRTLFVDPSISLGPISPLLYGSNYGSGLVVSAGMLQAAYDSGVTILRFPVGSWGEKTKPLQIGDQTTIQAEMWLFDPTHPAENVGIVELSDKITVPPQSVTLYSIP